MDWKLQMLFTSNFVQLLTNPYSSLLWKKNYKSCSSFADVSNFSWNVREKIPKKWYFFKIAVKFFQEEKVWLFLKFMGANTSVMLCFGSLYHFQLLLGYYSKKILKKSWKIRFFAPTRFEDDVITKRGHGQICQNFQESI